MSQFWFVCLSVRLSICLSVHWFVTKMFLRLFVASSKIFLNVLVCSSVCLLDFSECAHARDLGLMTLFFFLGDLRQSSQHLGKTAMLRLF